MNEMFGYCFKWFKERDFNVQLPVKAIRRIFFNVQCF